MKKLIALFLTAVLLLTVSLAFARTVEPDDTEIERLAGKTVHATVGAYDEGTKTFTVTVYDYERYDDDDIFRLAVGDTILAGGWMHTITGTEDIDGTTYYLCDDGEEICFETYDDDMIAMSSMDDRIFMNVVTVVHIPAAEGMVYEDYSDPDPDAKPVITDDFDSILKIKAEKEETSNGFNFYATTITLNKNLEIVKIHQVFDVAQ